MQDFLRIFQLIGYVLRLTTKPPRKNRWEKLKKKYKKESNDKKAILRVV